MSRYTSRFLEYALNIDSILPKVFVSHKFHVLRNVNIYTNPQLYKQRLNLTYGLNFRLG